MAKNIEMNLKQNNGDYEILYPKVDLTNNQGSLLPISNTTGSIDISTRTTGNLDISNRSTGNLDISNRTTGNLPSSRLSAGTLSGNFTFSNVPYCSISPSSSYYLANKYYVDQKVANIGGNFLQYKTGTYYGNGATSFQFYIGNFPSQMTYLIMTQDDAYFNLNWSMSEYSVGSDKNQAPYFSDIRPVIFAFVNGGSYGDGLDACVATSGATATANNSSLSSKNVIYIYTNFSSGYFSVEYRAMYNYTATLSMTNPAYNTSGRNYRWLAYGY